MRTAGAEVKAILTNPRMMRHMVLGGHTRHAHDIRSTRRNDPCPCGSGKKYKKCCIDR